MTFNADIFDKHHNLSKPTDLWFPGKGLLCSFMFTYRIYGAIPILKILLACMNLSGVLIGYMPAPPMSSAPDEPYKILGRP